MKLIKDPFLPIFPFSMEHQYFTAEKVISMFRVIKKKATTKNEDSKPKAKAFIDSAWKYYLQRILTKENDGKLTVYRNFCLQQKDFIGMDKIGQ